MINADRYLANQEKPVKKNFSRRFFNKKRKIKVLFITKTLMALASSHSFINVNSFGLSYR